MISYPIVSSKVPTTLTTPYSYPMGYRSHSYESKNGQQWLKTDFWRYLSPKPLILHTNMFYGLISGVQLSYGIRGRYFFLNYKLCPERTSQTHKLCPSNNALEYLSWVSVHLYYPLLPLPPDVALQTDGQEEWKSIYDEVSALWPRLGRCLICSLISTHLLRWCIGN